MFVVMKFTKLHMRPFMLSLDTLDLLYGLFISEHNIR